MKTIIRNRYYLLREKNARVLVSHTPGFLHEKMKVIKRISRSEINKMIKESLATVTKLTTTNSVMQDFWHHLPKEIQEDLTLSFHYHKHLKNHKVLNVQTVNWEKIKYFSDEYLRLTNKHFDIRHPLQSIHDIIRTSGKHAKGLRCKNIHIAMDHIGDKIIHQTHWDTEMPTTLPKMIKHFIVDDIIG